MDDGFEKALIIWNDVHNLTVTSWNRGQVLAREWTRAVNFGNVTLEEIIFSEDIKQEQLEARQKATEKLKAAIDAMNQKIKEQQAEEAGSTAQPRQSSASGPSSLQSIHWIFID